MSNGQSGGLGTMMIVVGLGLAAFGGYILLTLGQTGTSSYIAPHPAPSEPAAATAPSTNKPATVQVLEEELRKQQEKIDAARKKVDALRKELAPSNPRSTTNTLSTIRRLERSRVETEARMAQKETTLARLKAMNPAEARAALPGLAPDPELNRLLTELNVAQQKLEREKVSPEGTNVQSAQKAVDDLERRLNQRADEVIVDLQNNVETLKAQVAALQGQIDQVKEADVAAADRARPYADALDELDKEQQFGEVLSEQLATQKTRAEEMEQARSNSSTINRRLPSTEWNWHTPSTGVAALAFGAIMVGAGFWSRKG